MLAEQLAERQATKYDIQAANPRWSADDVLYKLEASRRCDPAVIEAVFQDNRPWAHAACSTASTSC